MPKYYVNCNCGLDQKDIIFTIDPDETSVCIFVTCLNCESVKLDQAAGNRVNLVSRYKQGVYRVQN